MKTADGAVGATPAGASTDLAVVCWTDKVEGKISGHPLPRRRAEEVAAAFARAFPRHTYWVEPVPWLRHRPGA
jgi:hypothetical protein